MVTGFEVHVDAAALADMERAEEAARAHAAAREHAMRSAGGTVTMAGPDAHRIQWLGGTATMAGPHAHRIHTLGGTAVMAGPDAHRIHTLGGESGVGVLKPQLSEDKLKDRSKLAPSHIRSPQVCEWGCGAKASSKHVMANHYRLVRKAHQTPGAKIPCNCPGP